VRVIAPVGDAPGTSDNKTRADENAELAHA
jgi:hypothetical protein